MEVREEPPLTDEELAVIEAALQHGSLIRKVAGLRVITQKLLKYADRLLAEVHRLRAKGE